MHCIIYQDSDDNDDDDGGDGDYDIIMITDIQVVRHEFSYLLLFVPAHTLSYRKPEFCTIMQE